MTKRRRKFSLEFKAEVADLVLRHNRTVGDVCREMDLVESVVRRWVQQAQVDRGEGPDGAVSTVEREELTRLRREVRRLQMERDILKKATAFFAKEST
jgi:transposase-like protein